MSWSAAINQFWPHAAAGFYLAACLLATGHALLRKRDTRAAIIWLVVIWTLPALGPLLYLVAASIASAATPWNWASTMR